LSKQGLEFENSVQSIQKLR